MATKAKRDESIYDVPEPGASCCWCDEPATVCGVTGRMYEPACPVHRRYLDGHGRVDEVLPIGRVVAS